MKRHSLDIRGTLAGVRFAEQGRKKVSRSLSVPSSSRDCIHDYRLPQAQQTRIVGCCEVTLSEKYGLWSSDTETDLRRTSVLPILR